MAKTIGRYEIREELGRGGMAVVYLAHDARLDRQVALKLLDHQLSADPAFAARFEQEAKTVASLSHTAIVSLYDYGESGGWLYLVMPYMKGGSLKELIARKPLTPEVASNVVVRIGGVLDKAHSQGIVHRDLKPANILLDEEGQPYLSDFGIIKMAGAEAGYLTDTGRTLGTFAYMSPEQVMGEELDGRSDIYALGLVLYEMLTGKHPYAQANTDGAMAVAQTRQAIPDITKENPALPAACQVVIEKAMAKDPDDRYASGAEMSTALQAALVGEIATVEMTRPVAPVGALAGAQKRKIPAWLFAVIGLVVVALIAAGAVVLGGSGLAQSDATDVPSPTAVSQDETNENQEADNPPPAVVVNRSGPETVEPDESGSVATAEAERTSEAALTATAAISESAVITLTLTPTATGVAGSSPAVVAEFSASTATPIAGLATSTAHIPATSTATNTPAPTATPAAPTPKPSPTPNAGAASALYAAAVQSFDGEKNAQKAAGQIDEAIALDPTVADYYYLRARIRTELSNHEGALLDIAEAIRLRPNKADYYQWRGYWYWNRSLWEQSIPDLEKAVQLNPSHSYQLTVLARAYKFVGNIAKMHQAYQQSINVAAANDFFPYTNYAYNLFPDLGTFDEAVAILYDCEARLTSNAHKCAWDRASISVTANRVTDAVAAYKRYLELVPQGTEPNNEQYARDYISQHGG